VFSMHDDFGTGNNSSPTIGELGWTFEFIAGSGLFSAPAGTYPNLGIAHVESGPNTNDGTAFFLGRSGAGSGSLLGNLAGNTMWELKFRFSLGSTTSQKTRVGLSDDPVAAVCRIISSA